MIQYTLYGHIGKLAEGIQQGIKAAGGQAQIFQYLALDPQSTSYDTDASSE